MPAPVASGGSESPGGPCTHWKAPPCHSPTSYFILRNINLLRHNIQILANMVGRSARRRPPLCVAARRALIFEGWVRGPEFTHTDHAVNFDNGIGWTIIVVAAGHRHYGGVVAPPARGLDGARKPLWPYCADTGVAGAFRRSQPGVQRGHRGQNSGDVDGVISRARRSASGMRFDATPPSPLHLQNILRGVSSMSFRRRSVWIAWLLPKPKVLELLGHSAFNRT